MHVSAFGKTPLLDSLPALVSAGPRGVWKTSMLVETRSSVSFGTFFHYLLRVNSLESDWVSVIFMAAVRSQQRVIGFFAR